jgi:hypothetical protein
LPVALKSYPSALMRPLATRHELARPAPSASHACRSRCRAGKRAAHVLAGVVVGLVDDRVLPRQVDRVHARHAAHTAHLSLHAPVWPTFSPLSLARGSWVARRQPALSLLYGRLSPLFGRYVAVGSSARSSRCTSASASIFSWRASSPGSARVCQSHSVPLVAGLRPASSRNSGCFVNGGSAARSYLYWAWCTHCGMQLQHVPSTQHDAWPASWA